MAAAGVKKGRGRPRLSEEEKAKRAAAKAAKPKKKRGPKPKAEKAKAKKSAPTIMLNDEGIEPETKTGDPEDIIKRYRGRPSKYEPRFCEMVVAWGAQGKSRTWIAGKLMVTRGTLDNWAKDNPEFLNALETAKALEQIWWEDEGQTGMKLQGFGQSIWSRNMAARFPSEWTERKERSITVETHEEALARLAAMEDA